MSVLTLEGKVEAGQIRLLGGERLPDETRVYVVVPDAARQGAPRVSSPRLADPRQAARFALQVTEIGEAPADAELRRR